MFIAILDHPPRSIHATRADQVLPYIPNVVGVIASDRELVLIREQFVNIPFNVLKHDSQTWHGETARFICSNFIWPDSEDN